MYLNLWVWWYEYETIMSDHVENYDNSFIVCQIATMMINYIWSYSKPQRNIVNKLKTNFYAVRIQFDSFDKLNQIPIYKCNVYAMMLSTERKSELNNQLYLRLCVETFFRSTRERQ